MTNEPVNILAKQVMSPESFAALGGGEVAYVRPLNAEEAKGLFPQMPQVTPNLELWALRQPRGGGHECAGARSGDGEPALAAGTNPRTGAGDPAGRQAASGVAPSVRTE